MNDLAGRRVLVTGANTGIGRAIALDVARRGAAVTLACRSVERAASVLDAIRAARPDAEVDLVALDLASLASVRRAAAELVADRRPLHVLVNNAGVAGQRGATAEGFELQFGVNHLGHFLLAELLRDRLIASAPARVVAVSSNAHYGAQRIDWDALGRPTASWAGYREYEVSKLCNVLHMAELARRLAGTGVTAYAAHPGVVASEIWRRLPRLVRAPALAFMRSPEEGAASTLRCATAAELAGESGGYYDEDGHPRRPSRLGRDVALAAELWRRSEAMVRGAVALATAPAAPPAARATSARAT